MNTPYYGNITTNVIFITDLFYFKKSNSLNISYKLDKKKKISLISSNMRLFKNKLNSLLTGTVREAAKSVSNARQ